MGGQIEIRKMEIDDLNSVFKLGNTILTKNLNFSLKWNEKNIADILSGSLEISFVAARKKSVVGFLIGAVTDIYDNYKTAEILWLCVKESLRNRGIENDLFQSFKHEIISKDIKKISIHIPESNSGSVNFFNKIGFTETGYILTMELDLSKIK